MNLWWLLLIPIIIFFGIFLYYKLNSKEGFQTISNIQYQLNEVFLVAPTLHSEKGSPVSAYIRPEAPTYTKQGYSWDDAKKICLGYGGDLATQDEVNMAYKNGGNWCPSGWINDSPSDTTFNSNNRQVYYLPSNNNTCGLTTIPATAVTGPPVSNLSGTKMAFAICSAPKPAHPSVSVHYFNDLQYSMIPDMLLNAVMDGSGTDLFPLRFTPSQAYYAILKQGIVDTTGKFSWSKARDWLKENYNTVDKAILDTQGYIDSSEKWTTLTTASTESCNLIKNQDNIISNQILILQNAFKDISGYVLATIQSKDENSKMQGMMYELCRGTTPESSPACAKLATLDFDLFYTDPTRNTLADLEDLNIQIFLRREEICQMLYNIRLIKNTLGCTYPNIADCNGCVSTPATITTKAVYDCSNTTLFDLNNVDGLKYSLEEISPLFEIQAYKSLLSSVIENLSYIVETPTLAKYESADNNTKLTIIALNQIKDLLPDKYLTAIASATASATS